MNNRIKAVEPAALPPWNGLIGLLRDSIKNAMKFGRKELPFLPQPYPRHFPIETLRVSILTPPLFRGKSGFSAH